MNTLLISGGYDSIVLKAFLEHQGIPLNLEHFCITVNGISKKGENKFFKDGTPLTLAGSEDDYIACRNSLLLFHTLNKLLTLYPKESHTIYFGFIKNFPYFADASPSWINEVNEFLKQEFSGKVKVEAPFIEMTKDEVYKLGCSLGVKLDNTFSCNFEDKKGNPCGKCDNCLWRAKHTYPIYERR